MITEKRNKQISKFLSLILRHQPEKIGLELDENGWADVQELIQKSNAHGLKFDFPTLKHVVDTNNKKRFAFDSEMDRIRASQGHSIDIELGYTNQEPPKFLFHGTAQKAVPSILEVGLEKRNRQHVHLSVDLKTATSVGQRHGKPFVFKVLAGKMYQENFEFFLSENGVWLTDHVPPAYLIEYEDNLGGQVGI